MKNIKYIGCFILFAILFGACEDYLTEKNKSGITADPFYDTEEGVEALVNSCYTPLRLWYGKEGGASLTELGTDLFVRGGDCKHPELSMYDNINFNGQTPIIKVYWDWFYAAINWCNTALNYLEDSPLSDNIEDLRKGEVHFLRAFYLWHITEIWGDVAFSTEESIGVITTAERRPVSEFYQQILEDLDNAISFLNGRTAHENGRITKPAAEAFKARVLLTRASASYVGGSDQNSDYQQAAQLAKKVISDYSFQLADDYAYLWDMENSEGSTNGEVIFYCNYTNDYTLGDYNLEGFDGNADDANAFRTAAGNHLHLMYCPRYDFHPGMDIDLSGIGYQRYASTKHLVDLFDEEIDQRYYGTFREVWYCNNTSVGDYVDMQIGDTSLVFTKKVVSAAERQRVATRYRLMDATDIFDANDVLIDNRNFIQMNKHSDPTRATAMDVRSSRDAFIIRIAEMYLIVAEATMQTGATSEAVEYMNILRSKRAYTGKEEQMKITQADLNIDFILEERARELVGENLRWFDLKRTNKLLEYVQKYNSDGKDNIKEYHMLRPIPQTQLDAVENKDTFKQNPGYN
ncbi:MAG: RagB/SusD family nutrient uptake outer membrane protein [Tannerellaceae bacterium]|nr:RagB/SusD family nutrient uptake outer membrane protein [Tannerellaceae bacterium]